MKISIIVEAVRNHICKWKDTYEVLGVVTAFAVSTLALVQSTIILRLQSKEFHLRNRPYVVLTNPRFDGAGVDTARQTYPHTVDIETHNISEVPATQIKTLADIFINGIRVWGTVYPSTALTKADPKTIKVFLTDEIFSEITNASNHVEIRCKTTYSGALGEDPEEYQTDTHLEYYVQDGTIRPERINFK